ncbi:MAG: hypothetical protein M3T96_07510 [Acidobacteriota bacterium]|nr:hypothetical protein [Acidobacteriota bacterium]
MVKQNKQNIAIEIDKLNEKETLAVASYVSQILTSRSAKSRETNNQTSDDLIVSLSDAYENKRARQVFEWERARRQNAPRAA